MSSIKKSIIENSLFNQINNNETFINARIRKTTLRSFSNKKITEKDMFNNYTNYVICNTYYMTLFLEYLKKKNETVNSKLIKDYVKELTKEGHKLIDSYENSETDGKYLLMCNYVKVCIDSAKQMVKHIKK